LRISVYIDHKFAFGIYIDTLLQSGYKKGDLLSIEQQETLLVEDQVPLAKQKALHYIGYRPRTEREVRKKLKEEDFSEAVIDVVIARLIELAFLDDKRFANLFCESRLKKYGPERVKMDLRRLGIADAHIQAALESQIDPEAQTEQIEILAEKLLQKYTREPDLRKRQQKLYAALVRRGYSYDLVGETVKKAMKK
jgi:regulatory protein